MFLSNKPIIRHKSALLNFPEVLGKESQADTGTDFMKNNYYRYQQAVVNGGLMLTQSKPLSSKLNPHMYCRHF